VPPTVNVIVCVVTSTKNENLANLALVFENIQPIPPTPVPPTPVPPTVRHLFDFDVPNFGS
jgi:hypothetical protein